MIISISQFQQIHRIKQNNYPSLKEELLIVGVLHNMNYDEVMTTEIDRLNELKKSLSYLDFEPPKSLIPEFLHNGVNYKVDTIFKLAGQFMDFSELHKDVVNNLHLILALFAYNGENYTHSVSERGEQFKETDYRIAYSVAFFFSRFSKELQKSTEIYLTGQGVDGMKKNGDGKPRSTDSQMETVLSGTFLSRWAARNFLGTYLK